MRNVFIKFLSALSFEKELEYQINKTLTEVFNDYSNEIIDIKVITIGNSHYLMVIYDL